MSRWFVGAASIAAVLLVGLLTPGPAQGHLGGEPFVHVPLTDVAPGSSFPVIVADLGTGDTVTFELLTEPKPVALGEAAGTPDGHFETTLLLPASTPDGYLQLRASIPDGTEAMTWIHVLAGAPSAVPPTADSFEFVPFAAGGLALAALVLLFVRTRQRPRSPASR